PLPGAAGQFDPGAVPLPGASGHVDQGAVPLPGGAGHFDQGAVPLPGGAGHFDQGAVPLPGGAGHFDQGAVPLPGGAGPADETDFGSLSIPGATTPSAPPSNITLASDGRAIPLPGGAAGAGAIPLPGAAAFEEDSSEAATSLGMATIPLPGAAEFTAPAAPAIPLPGAYGDSGPGAIPLPGATTPMAPAIALPGAALNPFGGDTTMPGEAIALPAPLGESEPANTSPYGVLSDPPGSAPAPESTELGLPTLPPLELPPAAPAAADPFDVDLGIEGPPPPAAAPAGDDFQLDLAPPPPPARAPSLDDGFLPSPKGMSVPEPGLDDTFLSGPKPHQTAPSLDDGLLPTPRGEAPPAAAEAAPSSFELNDLPMPSMGSNLPSPAAAPSVNPSTSFGDVDLGGGESLEFDPGDAPAKDALEADLNAPLPPKARPGAAADGLEMLSFIDDTAKKEGAGGKDKVQRFHIRRRSGKTFGPFEGPVIVKMLEDGQLLGNEEVSLDGESWQPIGAEASFQAAIAALMDSPARAATAAAMPAAGGGDGAPATQASMERLKQLYDGRMAAVAVVQGREPVAIRKRLPMIIAVAVLLLVVGAGLSLGSTPYGVFGLKMLLPATIKPGMREYADLNAAKQALLADTFSSYRAAKTGAEGVLKVKEYPEARAVWCQAVFYLQRRYAAANPVDAQEAVKALDDIELLGKKHVEVTKAKAGAALAQRQSDAALTLLADALARSENGDDLELLFLRVEAERQKGQNAPAKTDLEAILKKRADSARALHALGELQVAAKQMPEAKASFEAALKADPEHVGSAIELAAIALLEEHQADAAVTSIEAALEPSRRDKLGPSEIARALALKGESLAQQKKDTEAIALFEDALKQDPKQAFARTRLGALYLSRKDFTKALPILQDAAKATPESFEATEAFLLALIGVGKMQDARTTVAEAAKRFPSNARLSYLKGNVEITLGKRKEAEAAWLSAVSADGSLVEPRLALADLYLKNKQIDAGRKQIEEAAALPGQRTDVLIAQARLFLIDQKLSEADKASADAVALTPQSADARVVRGQVLNALGKSAEAEAEVLKALEVEPAARLGQQTLGEALRAQGKLDQATAALEKARQADPTNAQATLLLGVVQREKGDLAGAAGTLLAAQQADPGNPECWYQLGLVRTARREFNTAVDTLKKAIEYSPKQARFHLALGDALLGSGKVPEAQASWKQALALDPKLAAALEALGRLALDRNDYKGAYKYLSDSLTIEASRAEVWVALGDAQVGQENFEGAVKSFTKALELKPDLTTIYFRLGQAHQAQHRYADASSWYRKATKAEPNNAGAWLSLGWACKEQKQRAEAKAAFKQYLTLKPDADNRKEIEDEIDYLASDN
ncbi:MAG: tetratricopeptide repeat protein, partial [Myxococcaceae bacterium]|nr:tetratricopeptide repeat protein [Myxococcaceae bacterium]